MWHCCWLLLLVGLSATLHIQNQPTAVVPDPIHHEDKHHHHSSQDNVSRIIKDQLSLQLKHQDNATKSNIEAEEHINDKILGNIEENLKEAVAKIKQYLQSAKSIKSDSENVKGKLEIGKDLIDIAIPNIISTNETVSILNKKTIKKSTYNVDDVALVTAKPQQNYLQPKQFSIINEIVPKNYNVSSKIITRDRNNADLIDLNARQLDLYNSNRTVINDAIDEDESISNVWKRQVPKPNILPDRLSDKLHSVRQHGMYKNYHINGIRHHENIEKRQIQKPNESQRKHHKKHSNKTHHHKRHSHKGHAHENNARKKHKPAKTFKKHADDTYSGKNHLKRRHALLEKLPAYNIVRPIIPGILDKTKVIGGTLNEILPNKIENNADIIVKDDVHIHNDLPLINGVVDIFAGNVKKRSVLTKPKMSFILPVNM